MHGEMSLMIPSTRAVLLPPSLCISRPALLFFIALISGPCCFLFNVNNIIFTCYLLLFYIVNFTRGTFPPNCCLAYTRHFKNCWVNKRMDAPNSRDVFLFSHPAVTPLPLSISPQVCLFLPPSVCANCGACTSGGRFGSSLPTSLMVPSTQASLHKESIQWIFSLFATVKCLAFIEHSWKVFSWFQYVSRATKMPPVEAAHVHSEGVVVSTVLDWDSTAQGSRPSGSLGHRKGWYWSRALSLLMWFSDEVWTLLTVGSLREKNTGTELVSNVVG